jgi:DNA replication protein DnaC
MNAPSCEPARTALMLNELRLPTIGRLWSQFAERSDKESWPAGRFLAGLLEHELAERATRRLERHRVESQLDPTKTLASFEFAEVPMLSKAHVMALASGDSWLEKGASVLIFGPPGVGKSHVGCGIGHALIDAGYRVLYMRTTELVQRLQAARQSLQLPQALAKLDRYDLLILDDISYVRKDQAVRADRRALRAAQHPHHGQPAVLRLGQRVPRPGYDRGRHRPPGPSLDDLRAA